MVQTEKMLISYSLLQLIHNIYENNGNLMLYYLFVYNLMLLSSYQFKWGEFKKFYKIVIL